MRGFGKNIAILPPPIIAAAEEAAWAEGWGEWASFLEFPAAAAAEWAAAGSETAV